MYEVFNMYFKKCRNVLCYEYNCTLKNSQIFQLLQKKKVKSPPPKKKIYRSYLSDFLNYKCIYTEHEKRLLLRCIHHFKSDLINNMDHMRISGNEPSSVILSQRKRLQMLKMIARKCRIKLKPEGMV